MIDPLQILQVTLYSKVLNELSTKLFVNNYTLVYFVFIYFAYKLVSTDTIKQKCKDVFNSFTYGNSSSLTITGHRKVYQSGFVKSKQIVYILYSEKFRAITHYLLHHKLSDISNFKEMAKLHFNMYEEEKTEYINGDATSCRLPKNNGNIQNPNKSVKKYNGQIRNILRI